MSLGQPSSQSDRPLSERELKIVEALYRLSPEGPRAVTYEDIVVKAWKLYPDAFGLRGHSDKYPDASDVHKPLYNALKSRGWVRTGARGQKKFTLTQAGWDRANRTFSESIEVHASAGRATRTTKDELRYLEKTTAANLFVDGKDGEILDTDFFAFYRTSVRASPQEFEGRLNSVDEALKEAVAAKIPTALVLCELDHQLRRQFRELIRIKSERKKRGG